MKRKTVIQGEVNVLGLLTCAGGISVTTGLCFGFNRHFRHYITLDAVTYTLTVPFIRIWLAFDWPTGGTHHAEEER